MEDISLIIDLVIALGIALVGGLVAVRLGLPVLVGYILAGIAIGPQTPGLVAHSERVELMANVGVAFLMFALGVEFSLAQLLAVRKIAFTAGFVQIPLSISLGFTVGLALGWDPRAAGLLGIAFMACSSIVVLKLTLGSGEATSPHAKAALGLGVLQDLTMIPLLALLPLLESDAGDILLQLAKSLGAATVSLVLVIVLGTRLVPRLLSFVSQTGARELFLLTILVIALGTAYAANQVGLSYALGAFLAGLVVSESEFDSHVLAEIIPLRDVFSTLFFVSLGMLIDPDFFFDHPGRIGAVVAVLVMGKILLSLAGFLLSGVGAAVATRAAILTGQIGEFSFVLASIGLSHLIIDDDQFSLILSIALASILVSPLALIAEPWLTPYVERLPFMRNRTLHGIDQDASYGDIRGHVVICGYGRVGRALALTLIRRELEFVVIEMNPAIVRDLQTLGIPALYGDSIGEPVLRRAGVEHAHVMAVTVPNTIGAVQTVRVAKRLNPDLYVVARAARAGELPDLRAVGANEIVQPEFEAGLEFLRHVLRSQDVSEREIERLVDHRRHMFYQEDNPMLALVALDERP
jgi:CPA2 family monovalent cation:H+ antiporter-2